MQDLPKYPGPAGRGEDDDEEDDEERANMLPAEQHWEREALISTKSAFPASETRLSFILSFILSLIYYQDCFCPGSVLHGS